MSLSVIVPYRNREEQLNVFVPFIKSYLPDANVFIIEQADEKPFNRGKLLNVGSQNAVHSSYYVFHDIDMLPIKVSYKERDGVTQIAFSDIQLIDYLGGVTMFNPHEFVRSGGYHNDFWHRAEDNEMRFNLKRRGVPVLNRFGIFKQLTHERPPAEFDPVLWQKAQLPRTKDMLKTCQYELISKELKDGYTHLRVLL